MSYKIGSFNVGGPIPLILTDAEAVADVIERHHLDIIAFQDMQGNVTEIVNKFCKTVCNNLNSFDYRSGRGMSADRSFAFLWKTNKVELMEEPIIYERYRTNFANEWSFKRDPLLGRFRTINGYEIRLINTHLFFTDIQQRLSECARITGDVYYSIASIIPESIGTKVFTLALGDYNLDCGVCNKISLENNFTNLVTVQEGCTTLKKYGNKDEGFVSTGLSNNSYDHFTYDKNKVESAIRAAPTAINVPIESFGGNYTKYFNDVSDHIPIIIEIF